jgi:(1->4)-alpha-D-glucan 1-alpha-D-glucosylmutase
MPVRIPLATYRLQLGPELGFRSVTALLPYLAQLGIGDIYASPILKARTGSTHGYDVTDPTQLNESLGGMADFEAMSTSSKARGIGLLLDIVPNHLAASSENPWWYDVLESGGSSRYAHYFDIQWRGPGRESAESLLLLPALREHYAKVLHGGGFALAFEERGFVVRYSDQVFPIDLTTTGRILGRCLEHAREFLPAPRALEELATLCALVSQLPARKSRPPRHVTERHRSKQTIKERLCGLYREEPSVKNALDATLSEWNGERGRPESVRELHQLLDAQCYRLAYWKTARLRVNYRRCFDVNELVGMRIDDPAVFAARHALLARLVRRGQVTGVRVDHVDGLVDPAGYLERLQACLGAGVEGKDDAYIIVEKILGRDEDLRENWPVHGTTGYDFLNAANRLFVEPWGLEELERHYAAFTGQRTNMAEVTYQSRKLVMGSLLSAELDALTGEISALAARDLTARDVSRQQLRRGLIELGAALPVCRTYVHAEHGAPGDRRLIANALQRAREHVSSREVSQEAYDFLEHVLLFEPSEAEPHQRERWLRTVGRWQQLTAPVMAKGFEDTACYVHNSALGLNEVGADPERSPDGFGLEPFHDLMARRGARWPGALNATATHHTKRGEDARARLAALAGVAGEWEQSVKRWNHMNQTRQVTVHGRKVPEPCEEELIYQALIGSWPLRDDELADFEQRAVAYVCKAAREAKRNTDWIEPDEDYESGLARFVRALLEPSAGNRFLRDFGRFRDKIAFYGAINSLSQTLLKVTVPGVPDVYQGCELWDLSFVDPDNRRSVDFTIRRELLRQLAEDYESDPSRLTGTLQTQWRDGRIKLYVLWRGLQLRQTLKSLFRHGAYEPLEVSGPRRHHVCTFARRYRQDWVITAVPRLVAKLTRPNQFPLGKEVWGAGAVALPDSAPELWLDELTGEKLETTATERGRVLRLHRLFARFPVVLLRSTR